MLLINIHSEPPIKSTYCVIAAITNKVLELGSLSNKHLNGKRLIMLILLMLNGPLSAATLTSSVNRNHIKLNETVTLTVSIDDQVNTDRLDLGELKQDFDVLGIAPSNNSSISIVNGQTTRDLKTRWLITLAAKRLGKLRIPALKIGNSQSPAIDILVVDGGNQVVENKPLHATVKAEQRTVYPGQQVIIELELTADMAVRDIRGEQISLENAEIQLLEQQDYQRIDNGIARQVVNWKYVVFPESPGTLNIPVQTFTGTKGGNNSFFSSRRTRGERVIARSNKVSVTVAEMPQIEGRVWLPASQVTINGKWSSDIAQIRVGEPITRTIEIVAEGQKSEAIPPLSAASNGSNYKRYRDQPQLSNNKSAAGIVGVRSESEAIVPTVSGVIKLEEQSISWWDTTTKRWAQAVLPAETLNVLPAIVTSSSDQDSPQFNSPFTAPSQQGDTNLLTNSASDHGAIWKLATLSLALICLMQFYLLARRKRQPLKVDTNTNPTDENKAWAHLQKSFNSGDTSRIRRDLLAWSQFAMPHSKILNLGSLHSRLREVSIPTVLSSKLSVLLNQLDAHLYKSTAEIDSIDLSNELSKTISKIRKILKSNNQAHNSSKPGLAPLYPI